MFLNMIVFISVLEESAKGSERQRKEKKAFWVEREMKTSYWRIIVICLLVVVLFLAYKKFVRIDIHFSCDYSLKPKKLLDIVKKVHPEVLETEWKIFFVFRMRPAPSHFETISKLHRLLPYNTSVLAILPKIQIPNELHGVPIIRSKQMRFRCDNQSRLNSAPFFFMILQNDRIDYIDDKVDLFSINMLVNQRTTKAGDPNHAIIGINQLSSLVKTRLEKGNALLWNIKHKQWETIKATDLADRVFFYHTDCSPCSLKASINSVNSETAKKAIIFSVLANSFDIDQYLAENANDTPIYIDQNDEFGLKAYFFGADKNPAIIDLNEGEQNDKK